MIWKQNYKEKKNTFFDYFQKHTFLAILGRDGQKNPTQKNLPKKTQKSPVKKTHQKRGFLGFFENSPKIIQKKAKNPIKPNKTP